MFITSSFGNFIAFVFFLASITIVRCALLDKKHLNYNSANAARFVKTSVSGLPNCDQNDLSKILCSSDGTVIFICTKGAWNFFSSGLSGEESLCCKSDENLSYVLPCQMIHDVERKVEVCESQTKDCGLGGTVYLECVNGEWIQESLFKTRCCVIESNQPKVIPQSCSSYYEDKGTQPNTQPLNYDISPPSNNCLNKEVGCSNTGTINWYCINNVWIGSTVEDTTCCLIRDSEFSVSSENCDRIANPWKYENSSTNTTDPNISECQEGEEKCGEIRSIAYNCINSKWSEVILETGICCAITLNGRELSAEVCESAPSQEASPTPEIQHQEEINYFNLNGYPCSKNGLQCSADGRGVHICVDGIWKSIPMQYDACCIMIGNEPMINNYNCKLIEQTYAHTTSTVKFLSTTSTMRLAQTPDLNQPCQDGFQDCSNNGDLQFDCVNNKWQIKPVLNDVCCVLIESRNALKSENCVLISQRSSTDEQVIIFATTSIEEVVISSSKGIASTTTVGNNGLPTAVIICEDNIEGCLADGNGYFECIGGMLQAATPAQNGECCIISNNFHLLNADYCQLYQQPESSEQIVELSSSTVVLTYTEKPIPTGPCEVGLQDCSSSGKYSYECIQNNWTEFPVDADKCCLMIEGEKKTDTKNCEVISTLVAQGTYETIVTFTNTMTKTSPLETNYVIALGPEATGSYLDLLKVSQSDPSGQCENEAQGCSKDGRFYYICVGGIWIKRLTDKDQCCAMWSNIFLINSDVCELYGEIYTTTVVTVVKPTTTVLQSTQTPNPTGLCTSSNLQECSFDGSSSFNCVNNSWVEIRAPDGACCMMVNGQQEINGPICASVSSHLAENQYTSTNFNTILVTKTVLKPPSHIPTQQLPPCAEGESQCSSDGTTGYLCASGVLKEQSGDPGTCCAVKDGVLSFNSENCPPFSTSPSATSTMTLTYKNGPTVSETCAGNAQDCSGDGLQIFECSQGVWAAHSAEPGVCCLMLGSTRDLNSINCDAISTLSAAGTYVTTVVQSTPAISTMATSTMTLTYKNGPTVSETCAGNAQDCSGDGLQIFECSQGVWAAHSAEPGVCCLMLGSTRDLNSINCDAISTLSAAGTYVTTVVQSTPATSTSISLTSTTVLQQPTFDCVTGDQKCSINGKVGYFCVSGVWESSFADFGTCCAMVNGHYDFSSLNCDLYKKAITDVVTVELYTTAITLSYRNSPTPTEPCVNGSDECSSNGLELFYCQQNSWVSHNVGSGMCCLMVDNFRDLNAKNCDAISTLAAQGTFETLVPRVTVTTKIFSSTSTILGATPDPTLANPITLANDQVMLDSVIYRIGSCTEKDQACSSDGNFFYDCIGGEWSPQPAPIGFCCVMVAGLHESIRGDCANHTSFGAPLKSGSIVSVIPIASAPRGRCSQGDTFCDINNGTQMFSCKDGAWLAQDIDSDGCCRFESQRGYFVDIKSCDLGPSSAINCAEGQMTCSADGKSYWQCVSLQWVYNVLDDAHCCVILDSMVSIINRQCFGLVPPCAEGAKTCSIDGTQSWDCIDGVWAVGQTNPDSCCVMIGSSPVIIKEICMPSDGGSAPLTSNPGNPVDFLPCNHGDQACSKDGKLFLNCVKGVWVSQKQATGTCCQMYGGKHYLVNDTNGSCSEVQKINLAPCIDGASSCSIDMKKALTCRGGFWVLDTLRNGYCCFDFDNRRMILPCDKICEVPGATRCSEDTTRIETCQSGIWIPSENQYGLGCCVLSGGQATITNVCMDVNYCSFIGSRRCSLNSWGISACLYNVWTDLQPAYGPGCCKLVNDIPQIDLLCTSPSYCPVNGVLKCPDDASSVSTCVNNMWKINPEYGPGCCSNSNGQVIISNFCKSPIYCIQIGSQRCSVDGTSVEICAANEWKTDKVYGPHCCSTKNGVMTISDICSAPSHCPTEGLRKCSDTNSAILACSSGLWTLSGTEYSSGCCTVNSGVPQINPLCTSPSSCAVEGEVGCSNDMSSIIFCSHQKWALASAVYGSGCCDNSTTAVVIKEGCLAQNYCPLPGIQKCNYDDSTILVCSQDYKWEAFGQQYGPGCCYIYDGFPVIKSVCMNPKYCRYDGQTQCSSDGYGLEACIGNLWMPFGTSYGPGCCTLSGTASQIKQECLQLNYCGVEELTRCSEDTKSIEKCNSKTWTKIQPIYAQGCCIVVNTLAAISLDCQLPSFCPENGVTKCSGDYSYIISCVLNVWTRVEGRNFGPNCCHETSGVAAITDSCNAPSYCNPNGLTRCSSDGSSIEHCQNNAWTIKSGPIDAGCCHMVGLIPMMKSLCLDPSYCLIEGAKKCTKKADIVLKCLNKLWTPDSSQYVPNCCVMTSGSASIRSECVNNENFCSFQDQYGCSSDATYITKCNQNKWEQAGDIFGPGCCTMVDSYPYISSSCITNPMACSVGSPNQCGIFNRTLMVCQNDIYVEQLPIYPPGCCQPGQDGSIIIETCLNSDSYCLTSGLTKCGDYGKGIYECVNNQWSLVPGSMDGLGCCTIYEGIGLEAIECRFPTLCFPVGRTKCDYNNANVINCDNYVWVDSNQNSLNGPGCCAMSQDVAQISSLCESPSYCQMNGLTRCNSDSSAVEVCISNVWQTIAPLMGSGCCFMNYGVALLKDNCRDPSYCPVNNVAKCSADGSTLLTCQNNLWTPDASSYGQGCCAMIGNVPTISSRCKESTYCPIIGKTKCSANGQQIVFCVSNVWTALPPVYGPNCCQMVENAAAINPICTNVNYCEQIGSRKCSTSGTDMLECVGNLWQSVDGGYGIGCCRTVNNVSAILPNCCKSSAPQKCSDDKSQIMVCQGGLWTGFENIYRPGCCDDSTSTVSIKSSCSSTNVCDVGGPNRCSPDNSVILSCVNNNWQALTIGYVPGCCSLVNGAPTISERCCLSTWAGACNEDKSAIIGCVNGIKQSRTPKYSQNCCISGIFPLIDPNCESHDICLTDGKRMCSPDKAKILNCEYGLWRREGPIYEPNCCHQAVNNSPVISPGCSTSRHCSIEGSKTCSSDGSTILKCINQQYEQLNPIYSQGCCRLSNGEPYMLASCLPINDCNINEEAICTPDGSAIARCSSFKWKLEDIRYSIGCCSVINNEPVINPACINFSPCATQGETKCADDGRQVEICNLFGVWERIGEPCTECSCSVSGKNAIMPSTCPQINCQEGLNICSEDGSLILVCKNGVFVQSGQKYAAGCCKMESSGPFVSTLCQLDVPCYPSGSSKCSLDSTMLFVCQNGIYEQASPVLKPGCCKMTNGIASIDSSCPTVGECNENGDAKCSSDGSELYVCKDNVYVKTANKLSYGCCVITNNIATVDPRCSNPTFCITGSPPRCNGDGTAKQNCVNNVWTDILPIYDYGCCKIQNGEPVIDPSCCLVEGELKCSVNLTSKLKCTQKRYALSGYIYEKNCCKLNNGVVTFNSTCTPRTYAWCGLFSRDSCSDDGSYITFCLSTTYIPYNINRWKPGCCSVVDGIPRYDDGCCLVIGQKKCSADGSSVLVCILERWVVQETYTTGCCNLVGTTPTISDFCVLQNLCQNGDIKCSPGGSTVVTCIKNKWRLNSVLYPSGCCQMTNNGPQIGYGCKFVSDCPIDGKRICSVDGKVALECRNGSYAVMDPQYSSSCCEMLNGDPSFKPSCQPISECYQEGLRIASPDGSSILVCRNTMWFVTTPIYGQNCWSIVNGAPKLKSGCSIVTSCDIEGLKMCTPDKTASLVCKSRLWVTDLSGFPSGCCMIVDNSAILNPKCSALTSCTVEGQSRCSADGSSIFVCRDGAWLSSYGVLPPGSCISVGDSAIIDPSHINSRYCCVPNASRCSRDGRQLEVCQNSMWTPVEPVYGYMCCRNSGNSIIIEKSCCSSAAEKICDSSLSAILDCVDGRYQLSSPVYDSGCCKKGLFGVEISSGCEKLSLSCNSTTENPACTIDGTGIKSCVGGIWQASSTLYGPECCKLVSGVPQIRPECCAANTAPRCSQDGTAVEECRNNYWTPLSPRFGPSCCNLENGVAKMKSECLVSGVLCSTEGRQKCSPDQSVIVECLGGRYVRKSNIFAPGCCFIDDQGTPQISEMCLDANKCTAEETRKCSADGSSVMICSLEQWVQKEPLYAPNCCKPFANGVVQISSSCSPIESCSVEAMRICSPDGSTILICQSGAWIVSGEKFASGCCSTYMGIPKILDTCVNSNVCANEGARKCTSDSSAIVQCVNRNWVIVQNGFAPGCCAVLSGTPILKTSCSEVSSCSTEGATKCSADGSTILVCRLCKWTPITPQYAKSCCSVVDGKAAINPLCNLTKYCPINESLRCGPTYSSIERCLNNSWVTKTTLSPGCCVELAGIPTLSTACCNNGEPDVCSNNGTAVMTCANGRWISKTDIFAKDCCQVSSGIAQIASNCTNPNICTAGAPDTCTPDGTAIMSCIDGFWVIDKSVFPSGCCFMNNNKPTISASCCLLGSGKVCSPDGTSVLTCSNGTYFALEPRYSQGCCSMKSGLPVISTMCVPSENCIVEGAKMCSPCGSTILTCSVSAWTRTGATHSPDCCQLVNGVPSIRQSCQSENYCAENGKRICSPTGNNVLECIDHQWMPSYPTYGKGCCSTVNGLATVSYKCMAIENCFTEGKLICSADRTSILKCSSYVWKLNSERYSPDCCTLTNGVPSILANCTGKMACIENARRCNPTQTGIQRCLYGSWVDLSSTYESGCCINDGTGNPVIKESCFNVICTNDALRCANDTRAIEKCVTNKWVRQAPTYLPFCCFTSLAGEVKIRDFCYSNCTYGRRCNSDLSAVEICDSGSWVTLLPVAKPDCCYMNIPGKALIKYECREDCEFGTACTPDKRAMMRCIYNKWATTAEYYSVNCCLSTLTTDVYAIKAICDKPCATKEMRCDTYGNFLEICENNAWDGVYPVYNQGCCSTNENGVPEIKETCQPACLKEDKKRCTADYRSYEECRNGNWVRLDYTYDKFCCFTNTTTKAIEIKWDCLESCTAPELRCSREYTAVEICSNGKWQRGPSYDRNCCFYNSNGVVDIKPECLSTCSNGASRCSKDGSTIMTCQSQTWVESSFKYAPGCCYNDPLVGARIKMTCL